MEKEIVGIYVATKQKQYFTTKEIIFLGGCCRILSEPRPAWIIEEDDEEYQIVDVKIIMVGMSTDPSIGQFEVTSVYIRETLLHTLTIEDNVRQGDKGLYFVRNKEVDGKKVEVEFVADISATHTDQAGFAFCVYQHEKISSWIKNRRNSLSEERKTSRQTLLEQIRQRRSGK